MKKNSLIILMLILSFSAKAEEGFDFMYSLGVTFGGDKLAETTTGSSLKSGGLIYFGAGTVYSFSPDFQIQGTIAYHFDTLSADNGSADFDRISLEIIPFYIIDNDVRVGVGIVNVKSPEYSDPFDDIGFSDSTGLVAEIDWRLTSNTWWGIRYVDVDFDAESFNGIDVSSLGVTVDGNYFGLMYQGGF